MDVYEAVADPTRRRLLELLAAGPTPAAALFESFPVSQPAISRHLRVLRETGLVHAGPSSEDGRLKVYRLDSRPLREVQDWVAGFWQGQLDAFARYVETRP